MTIAGHWIDRTAMKRSRTLSFLLVIAVAMTMASSPAMAGKKKAKGEDGTHGHVYEPVAPIAHRRQALDNLEAEVINPKAAMVEEAKNEEPRLTVYPINGVSTLILHKLFE